jgi:hypothetical protein
MSKLAIFLAALMSLSVASATPLPLKQRLGGAVLGAGENRTPAPGSAYSGPCKPESSPHDSGK